MKLLELYTKYQNSGFGDNPIISTNELKLLNDKLAELQEFVGKVNLVKFSLNSDLESIDRILDNRSKYNGK